MGTLWKTWYWTWSHQLGVGGGWGINSRAQAAGNIWNLRVTGAMIPGLSFWPGRDFDKGLSMNSRQRTVPLSVTECKKLECKPKPRIQPENIRYQIWGKTSLSQNKLVLIIYFSKLLLQWFTEGKYSIHIFWTTAWKCFSAILNLFCFYFLQDYRLHYHHHQSSP